jgi:hypothetical protein
MLQIIFCSLQQYHTSFGSFGSPGSCKWKNEARIYFLNHRCKYNIILNGLEVVLGWSEGNQWIVNNHKAVRGDHYDMNDSTWVFFTSFFFVHY